MREPTASQRQAARTSPDAPVSLYSGFVMHARMRPVAHRFTYRATSILVDIDRLDEADAQAVLFSTRRPNLFSFRETDHGAADGTPLRSWIEDRLAGAQFDRRPAKILLLCYPRVLGYVFNPLSVYFCYREDGTMLALVYHVCNTFGERHAYPLPVRDEDVSEAGIRHEHDKLLYVSPFLDMDLRYRFRVRPPGRTVALRILESDAEGPILAAAFHGERHPVSSSSLARMCLGLPFFGFKVIAAIHWEALKLWLKGVPLYRRRRAPARTEASVPPPLGK